MGTCSHASTKKFCNYKVSFIFSSQNQKLSVPFFSRFCFHKSFCNKATWWQQGRSAFSRLAHVNLFGPAQVSFHNSCFMGLCEQVCTGHMIIFSLTDTYQSVEGTTVKIHPIRDTNNSTSKCKSKYNNMKLRVFLINKMVWVGYSLKIDILV